MFADLFVNYPVDALYTYKIPEDIKVSPGMRVKVNFSGRDAIGYIEKIHNNKPTSFKTKAITSVVDDETIFDQRLIDLSRFIAENYLSNIGEVLSLAVPSGLSASNRYKIPFARNQSNSKSLSEEQSAAYQDISESYKNGHSHHLIFGITGSGKTEIYIDLAKKMIEQGRSVIYLVPEISLSSQIFERLYNVFGDNLVIYHSNLTANQRLHNWKRFYSGDAKIAIGTRSAVFLQCPDLGLIIIDEEHDGSYKENSSPRYNARRVAFYRSRMENALLVLGSATPSIESLYACEKNIIKLHRLEKRFGDSILPEIEIIKIKPSNSDKIISPILKLHTKRTIDEGNQVIYLLNRRGFSPLVLCDSCGITIECSDCNIGMNYHNSGNMHCHYCGFKMPIPKVCPECGSDEIIKLGAGTQKIEELINNEFRDFNVFRLDQDTSRKKGAVDKLIKDMNNGDIDILLGTQLVAKGFDFHNVTLVGILMSDIGLNLPDFRASERIFSLITQVSGRSGRGDLPGRVILQTLNDEHPIFTFIRSHDYYGFYKQELEVRKSSAYPPFIRIIRLLIRGKDEEKVMSSIGKLKDLLDERILESGENIVLLGPSSAPFPKIGGNFRHHIILKTKKLDLLRNIILESKKKLPSNGTYLEIDVDPYDLL